MHRLVFALFLLAPPGALTLGACASSSGGWRELDSVDALKAAFNADGGHVRLVLLLSPT